MQDTEYTKKDLSIQCIQYIMFVTLYMGLLLQEEHILHFRETQWVFSSDVRETLVLFAVCPFFVISFIFFTFDNILYAQKHHSRSKLISLRLKNHINIGL